MPLYIPEWVWDCDAETTIYVYLLASNSYDWGYRCSFNRVENVRVIQRIEEGRACPAWYPDWTPDTYSCAVSGRWDDLVTRGWGLESNSEYLQWNVPAYGNGATKLVVCYNESSSGGEFKVTKNYGEADEDLLDTIDSYSIGTGYRVTATIDLAGKELTTGDTIRIWREGVAARTMFNGFYAYDDSKTPSSLTTPYHLLSPNDCFYTDSMTGFNMKIAPSTEDPKWVGGSHQTQPGDCTEVNVTESWEVDGVTWSIAQGWKDGASITITTESQVDYDMNPTLIADLTYTYTFERRKYKVEWEGEGLLDLALWVVYAVVAGPIASFTQFKTSSETIDMSTQDSGHHSLTDYATFSSINCEFTPAGNYVKIALTDSTHGVIDAFGNPVPTTDRFYVQTLDPPSPGLGTVWGASWEMTFVVPGAVTIVQNPDEVEREYGRYLQGFAGQTITAGCPVYYDTNTKKIMKAECASTAAKADVVGIALNSAYSSQPIHYQVHGSLDLGADLTVGEPYYVQQTAGTIGTYDMLTTGDYVTFLGIATTTRLFSLQPLASGVKIA